jgi:hypothetical protein
VPSVSLKRFFLFCLAAELLLLLKGETLALLKYILLVTHTNSSRVRVEKYIKRVE